MVLSSLHVSAHFIIILIKKVIIFTFKMKKLGWKFVEWLPPGLTASEQWYCYLIQPFQPQSLSLCCSSSSYCAIFWEDSRTDEVKESWSHGNFWKGGRSIHMLSMWISSSSVFLGCNLVLYCIKNLSNHTVCICPKECREIVIHRSLESVCLTSREASNTFLFWTTCSRRFG